PERPDLALLPELFSTGYALDRAPELARRAPATLEALAGWARGRSTRVAGSLLHPWRGGVANAAFLIEPDGVNHPLYAKVHLFGPMAEDRHLVAGDAPVVWQSSLGPLAVATCYDLRFPVFCRRLALAGAGTLLVPAEWPAPRTAHWEVLLRARAVESQWFVLGANRTGRDGQTVFEGASQVVDPWGEVLGNAGAPEGVVLARIEPRRLDEARERIPVFRDQVPGLDG
ncbi:MAG: carbon-nitrogen family hydrolase, partial [Proteobacteria bacterium]|nr:carbon-nitrogen family hydrolase [Pseudomonadota bacterium]